MLQVQHVRISAQQQIPVGEQGPQHGEHHRKRQDHQRTENHTDQDAEAFCDRDSGLGQLRVLQRHTRSRLVDHPHRGRDHGQARETQRAVAQPRRPPAGQFPARRCILDRDGVGQQDRAQPGYLLRLDRVEGEHGVPLGLLSGADPQHGQAEHPVQQPGIGGHRPDPVARHRQHLALQQPGAQLHLIRFDAVAGGEPARHADGDGQGDRRDGPARVAGRRAQHHRTDQQRDLLQHFMDRVDQQHARAQPLPRRPDARWRPDGRLSRRSHVASCSPIAAMSVSCATTRSATSSSRATIRTAPAEDAVVTVTLARPNSRSSGPR